MELEEEKITTPEAEPASPPADAPSPENKATDDEKAAIIAMSKKLKEKEHQIAELTKKAAVAEEMTAQYNNVMEEQYASRAADELENFAKSYNIPLREIDGVIKNYAENHKAIYDNVGKLEEFMIKNHFETFKPYITGTAKTPGNAVPHQPINLATGVGGTPPTINKKDAVKRALEQYNAQNSLFGVTFNKRKG